MERPSQLAVAVRRRGGHSSLIEGGRPVPRSRRGQAMAEFALIMPIAVIVLLVGVQLALIGQATVAVSQLCYTGARYASVNPTFTSAQVKSYMQTVGSPTLMENGGADLSVAMTPCAAAPNTFGSNVQLTLTYNLNNKLFLPNPFLLAITFPTSVTETQTAFCE